MEGELTGYSGGDMPVSDTFFILSISSWIMLLITSWMPMLIFGIYKNKIIAYFWLIIREKEDLRFPLDMNFEVLATICIFTLIIGTIGFMTYVYCIYKGNNNVLNGMFGETSKFHFIPLLLISGLFIIGESYSNIDRHYYFNEAKYIFSIIFTFLAIITLVLISFRTKIESPWYAPILINKGAYSCFLALLIYNLGYVISIYGMYKLIKKGKYEDYSNWAKRCYLAFTIIIGILNNAFAFLLKDLVVSLMNLLIYIGMTISYFKLENEDRKSIYKNETIGIFQIIMMVISLAYITFHIIRYRGIIPNQF